jgi:hypothetical protein
MAINYSWEIIGLQVYPTKDEKENVIFQVDYNYKGVNSENEQYQYVMSGGVAIDEPTDSFIEFDNLDEPTVISWIENKLPVDSYNEEIEKQINNQINPPTVSKKAPWEVQENTDTVQENTDTI